MEVMVVVIPSIVGVIRFCTVILFTGDIPQISYIPLCILHKRHLGNILMYLV